MSKTQAKTPISRQDKSSSGSHHFDHIFKKAEEFLSADLLRHFPMTFYWMDKDGYLLGANDVQLELLGLNSLSQFVGQHVSSFGAIDLWENCQRVMGKNITEIFEEEHLDNRGQRHTFLAIKSPLQGKEKKVVGLVGVSIDITEKKNQALMYKTYLENILSIMPGHLFWKDKEGRFLGCNDQQAKTIGLDHASQLLGKNIYDVMEILKWSREAGDQVKKNDLEIMESRQPKILEEAVVLNGETRVYLSHKAPLYNEQHEVIGTIGSAIEITRLKKTEEELRKAKEETEMANARIKAMAGSIAHELRTPLGSFTMSLGALENGLLEDVSKDKMDYYHDMIHHLRDEIESANSVINMLLMNIREGVSWELKDLHDCSMNTCVQEALTSYPFVDNQKDLVKWKSGKDFMFKGHVNFMQHVLFNLIKNALHQIAKAGKGEISIWTKKESKGFSLHVKDTASGIPKDILSHLFERFFTRTKNGTGLGLAFCKMVIEGFGGSITCQSEEGQYTEFIIQLR